MLLPILTLAVLIVVFHYCLIYRFQISGRWWERVDYVWYGLGFFGILLAVNQLGGEQTQIRLHAGEQRIAKYTTQIDDLAKQFLSSSCDGSIDAACVLAHDIHSAYGETFLSDNWLNGSVHFQGRVYPSWNYFIKERAKEDGLKLLERELSMLSVYSTRVLEASDDVRPNPMAAYGTFKYNYYLVWPYVLAVGIALKVTKISARIRALPR